MITDWLFNRRASAVSVSVTEAAELLRQETRTLHERLGEGAVNINLAEPFLVICRSGHPSTIATRMLAQQGLKVKNVDGGMNAWRRAGLPIETRHKRS